MTKPPFIPDTQYEQQVEHEIAQHDSSSYWQKFAAFYPKVFDGMEYTAYIASGAEPLMVMVRIKAFVERHKTFFAVIGFIQLLIYLTSFFWIR